MIEKYLYCKYLPFLTSREEIIMDETLYTIKIDRAEMNYFGKLSNNNNEIKEFQNDNIADLLKDIVSDIHLDFDSFHNYSKDFFEEADQLD